MAETTKVKEAENLLSQVILSRGSLLTGNDIADIVNQFRSVLSDGFYRFEPADFTQLISSLEIKYVTTMGEGFSLIDQDVEHDEEWYHHYDFGWAYWHDYESLLINQGWPTRVVSSMNTVT